MTTEHTLTMLAILATIIAAAANLAGPALGAYVQARMNQPEPSPETNQQKKRSQTIGCWFHWALTSNWTFWPLWFVSIFCINYFLIVESRNTEPLTRGSVIEICILVAGILFQVMNATIRILITRVTYILEKQVRLAETQRVINRAVLDILDMSAVVIRTIYNRLPAQQERTVDKMLNRLKRLMGTQNRD